MASKVASLGNRSFFTRLSQATAHWAGKPQTFFIALAIIVVWAVSGPFFGFNDTWQLVINTSTTIVTFLMVFIIQNSQNRNARAVHVKLDEIIRSLENARNEFITTEKATEKEMETREEELRQVASEHPSSADARSRVQRR